MYGRTCASAEDIVLDPHTAGLGQHAARQIAPHDRTEKLQPRQLRNVEQIVIPERLGHGVAQPHAGIRISLVVEHLHDLGLADGLESRYTYDLHPVTHSRHVSHLRMGECRRTQLERHGITLDGSNIVIVSVDVCGVVTLSAEEASVEGNCTLTACEVRGVGICREVISVGGNHRQPPDRHVAAVETYDTHSGL